MTRFGTALLAALAIAGLALAEAAGMAAIAAAVIVVGQLF